MCRSRYRLFNCSWVSIGGRVHAGIFVRAVVRSTPPPGCGGRSILLIRVADLPSRISCCFPPLVVRLPGVVKSSCSDHLSFLPTIRATWKEIWHLAAGIYLPVAILATGEAQYRRKVPAGCRRTWLRCLCQRSCKQAFEHCFYISGCRARRRCLSRHVRKQTFQHRFDIG